MWGTGGQIPAGWREQVPRCRLSKGCRKRADTPPSTSDRYFCLWQIVDTKSSALASAQSRRCARPRARQVAVEDQSGHERAARSIEERRARASGIAGAARRGRYHGRRRTGAGSPRAGGGCRCRQDEGCHSSQRRRGRTVLGRGQKAAGGSGTTTPGERCALAWRSPRTGSAVAHAAGRCVRSLYDEGGGEDQGRRGRTVLG